MRIPEAEFFVVLGEYLKTKNIEMEFIVGHDAGGDVLVRAGFKCYRLSEYARKYADMHITGDFLREIKQQFGIDNVRRLYLREMFNLERFDETRMLKKTLSYLQIMGDVLKESSPRVVMQETGDFIAPMSLYYAARAQSIEHIFIEPAMFPRRIVFTFNNLYADASSYDIKKGSGEVHHERIEKYLQNYVRNKEVRIPKKDEKFFKDMLLGQIININNFKKIVRKLLHKYVLRKSEEYDAIGWYCRWHFVRFFRRNLLKKYYVHDIPGPQYVYFPFHVPLDLQLTTRAPEYLDQFFVIDYIARCLPYGYQLLIKEHPAAIGAYSYLRIKRLLRYNKNICIVHPRVNSYDLIENARCVVTINSKVGVEAIMQQKPVVVLGPAFYRGKGVTIDVNALRDLPKAIQDALAIQKIDENNVKKFLAEIYQWSWPGELFYNSPENIAEFSESLQKSIGAIKV